jgi:uncharacterized protein (TIGR02246 family)
MRKRLVRIALVLLIPAIGCGGHRHANLAAEETAIRTADANWLAATTSRDVERTVPFWSDDATILAPGSAPITGRAAIRQYVSAAFATPGFAITWKTAKIEVSQSGDIAYSTGTDWITSPGPDGKPVTEENNSVAIWKKEPDRSWKCILDVMTPAAAPDSPAAHR